jgi:asparagine synthase (glutamine-hydrolysing)
MTYVDLKLYLPGLNLAYMDKASMAASVEVRVPFLDEILVRLASRIPGEGKVSGTKTKIALRQAVQGKVPEPILTRPKAPFAAPIRSWLAGDLSEYVNDLLSPSRVIGRGILSPGVVHRLLREHATGREDHSLRIWALLTLEVWLTEFFDQRSWSRENDVPTEVSEVAEPMASS